MSIEAMKHKCIYPDCPYPCLDLPDCMDAKKQEADELTIAYMSGLYDGKKAKKREWIGLTDEEVKHEWEVWRTNVPRYAGFAKGIEAKLKEKNNA